MQFIIESRKLFTKNVLSALFYAGSTIQLLLVTAAISRRYVYMPHQVFVMGQMVLTIIMMWIGRCLNWLQFPRLDGRVIRYVFPLILLYCGGFASSPEHFGIISNSTISVTRRTVLLITMITVFERLILDIQMSSLAKYTIAAMVIGAMIGGTVGDSFSTADYFVILLHYCFAAATRVYLRKILNSGELGVSGLLYYSSIITFIPPMIVACVFNLWNITDSSIQWDDLKFWWHVFLTALISIMLTCSTIICIQYNGALTTTIIGSLVNTINSLITYYESVNDDDERSEFSWPYSLGWSIIVLASFVYILCAVYKSDSASNNALVSKNEDAIV